MFWLQAGFWTIWKFSLKFRLGTFYPYSMIKLEDKPEVLIKIVNWDLGDKEIVMVWLLVVGSKLSNTYELISFSYWNARQTD